ncbi:hypothetical protein BGZ76_010550 [Entomortierella beljakovae]|nr:hypothetical protein BGZ76_010550 [Entomortierella beljakovae]
MSKSREEWDSFLAELDSDGPAEDEDNEETDDEDWQELRKSIKNKPAEKGAEDKELTGSNRDKEEWDNILEEPDSESMRRLKEDNSKKIEQHKNWEGLHSRMNSEAANIKSTKPRDGATKQNLHHRNMLLKRLQMVLHLSSPLVSLQTHMLQVQA